MSLNIINPVEANRLQELVTIREMLSNDYLTDPKNTQTKFIFAKFFRSSSFLQQQERLALLNLSYSIPALVSEKFADYVGEPISPLEQVEIHQFVHSFIWGGYSVMIARLEDSELVVDYQSPDGYVKNDDGSEVIYTYITDYNAASQLISRYVLRQTYTPGQIENELFKVTTTMSTTVPTVGQSTTNFILQNINNNSVQVSLESIEATNELLPVEPTGLDRNPIVVVNDTFGNNVKYGDSTINKVRSLISSIEVQMVNIQDQMLKHLEAKMAVPNSAFNPDKKGLVNLSNMQVIGMAPGDPDAKYLVNTNALMAHAFTNIDKLIRQIAAVTSIPVEFLGLDSTGGVESGTAKSIRISPFLKKIELIRKKFKGGIKELLEIAEQWGAYNVESEEGVQIMFGEVFPTNKKAEADELAVARDAKLISHKKAIMRYNDLSAEEAEEELDRIKEESAALPLEGGTNANTPEASTDDSITAN
jgi:hypothetical protein